MTDLTLAQILAGIPDAATFNGGAAAHERVAERTRHAEEQEDPIGKQIAECNAALEAARDAVARQGDRSAPKPGTRQADVVSLDAYRRRRHRAWQWPAVEDDEI